MRRNLFITTTALLLMLSACGGSGGSKANGPATTASSAATTNDPVSTTTTAAVAVIEGDLLEAGDLPAPWVAATDNAVHTFSELGPKNTSAYSLSCPASIAEAAAGNTQCFGYADEGGPFAAATDTAADGTTTTTLMCQSGDADSLDFTAFATLDAKIALAGLGAVDVDGRAFAASAYTIGTGTEWFVVRRPAGQTCPVVWDLGADDGTLASVSALGAVILPLTDAPTCVFVVPEGLRTRPAEAGICTP